MRLSSYKQPFEGRVGVGQNYRILDWRQSKAENENSRANKDHWSTKGGGLRAEYNFGHSEWTKQNMENNVPVDL